VKLALELIPEERFADEKDDLVAWQNRRKAGNPIQRGIEFDQATGRTLAYWIRPAHPSDAGMAWEPVRIDARDCHYAFFKQRIGQRRGLSMLKAVVKSLWSLGYYQDNELMASAIKSCFAVMLKTGEEDADFAGLEDDSEGSVVTDMNGNPLEKIEPGIIGRFRGKDASIQGIGPNTPTSEQEAWILLIERTISIGMGLSYEEMFRDYSRGNFSSLRAGANRDRKQFRPLQKFVVNHFCRPTDLRFTKAASLAGLDGFPRPSQLQSDLDEWMKRNWRTEGWLSVNPWDDARAAVLEIDNGLGTREGYVSAKGGDWEENDQQQERERESAEAHGLNFGQPDQVDQGQGSGDRGQESEGQGQEPAGPPAKRKPSRAA
jgi:lambda family phage portal protein